MRKVLGVLVIVLFLVPAFLRAEEWPGWRGPRGDGASHETNIPLRWSRTENVCWKVPIPGRGYSSPIIWGDRIFLTSCLENKQERVLLCLDRKSGRTLGQQTVLTAPLEQKHDLNSFASSTPATDGKYVWTSFLKGKDIVLTCFDFEGKRVWEKSPGQFFSRHGFCSSPVLYKDTVILNCDQDAVAYIVAFDKTTGQERWRTDRPNRTRSYCVPILIDVGGRKQLVLSGSKCVASYNPDTGKQIWIIDGPTEQYVASLVFLDNILFLTAGFPTYHIMGIRPDLEGNVTKTAVLWHDTKGAAYVPSPLAHDKYFFVVSDKGLASCLEAKTGQRQWMERLGKHHSASAVSAGDYLYFPDDAGTTWVLKGGPQFEVVSKNNLGEECYASPAISRGQIFIRTRGNLYCIGKK